jgi:hypothetical protein
VTVIVGAKASNLEKGAKKVWGGLPKDAQVFNLEGGAQGIDGALKYLELLKRSMHEIMNIPETALGQVQAISNTSGVALSIQFQPLMNRYSQKVAQYGKGLERVNELALRTLFLKEPETMLYNPEFDGPIKEGQVTQIDPEDPISYQNYAHFPQPLPLDKLIALNEIQTKLGIGLRVQGRCSSHSWRRVPRRETRRDPQGTSRRCKGRWRFATHRFKSRSRLWI